MESPPPSFERFGPATPVHPIILSVPHAGRDYSPSLMAQARVPAAELMRLEDRLVDLLAGTARGAETLFVQRRPRAWVDLNRAEEERDPLIDDGAPPVPASAKVRSGLGVVPRRVGQHRSIWRARLPDMEVRARLHGDHRPYHEALGEALVSARERFGGAVLLDIHSMPTLRRHGRGASVVLGDRFGRTASARLVQRLERCVRAAGLQVALNSPYAGGHVIARHGRPDANVHAIQIEFDRQLYLDRTEREIGGGLADAARLLRAMIDAALDEITALPRAAE